MADTDDMAIFVRVVELGSLSAAGRDLRLSAAVVSNRIARLEQQLGARLLNRTTRRVGLTEEGHSFFAHSQRILNEMELAESRLAAQKSAPRGPIRITAPAAFGRLHLVALLPTFLAQFPEVELRLNLTDQLLDLVEERIDLAIRIAELKDSTAIVRKLAPNRRVIVAAPEYLERRGRPQRPADLLEHNCLLLRFPGSQQYHWTLQGPEGPVTLAVSGNMDSNSGEALRDWCLAGHGLALKSLWEVRGELDAGRLEVVLPDWPPPGHALYALYPHSTYLPPRVRALMDFLAESFGPEPPWERGFRLPTAD